MRNRRAKLHISKVVGGGWRGWIETPIEPGIRSACVDGPLRRFKLRARADSWLILVRRAGDTGADPPNVSEQVTVSATEYAQLRYVAGLIAEYEPGTRGATLRYIQEQAAKGLT